MLEGQGDNKTLSEDSTDVLEYTDNSNNLLQFESKENISFTPTRKVQISVRNLSIGSAIRKRDSLLRFKFHNKSSKLGDIESNDTIKTILYPMSFDIPSNSLTCIIGGSGSGKTTLLNCLADRQFNQNSMFKEGTIKYNNQDNFSDLRHAYVIQQDILIPSLTCYETLLYTAELKLPKLTSKEQRQILVHEIILVLGLKECKDTLVGDHGNKGLSGGERRRLSVGLQLISNPSILFLDEPTTGLDSYNAYLLCQSLKRLATSLNKTIIMSIHQPRADIFKLFDTVLILSKGKLCYGAKYADIFSYFDKIGYPVPELKVNPADFYIDITSIDARTRKKEIESTKRVSKIFNNWKCVMNTYADTIEEKNNDVEVNDDTIFQEVGRAPFWREVKILIRRNIKLQTRDPIGWFSVIMEALVLGLLCGWLFFKPGSSVVGIRSIESSLYTSCSLQSYLFLLHETHRLCQVDMNIFDRERMENCVSVPGFLIARRISKFMTEDLIIPFVFSITTYFMYGLRVDSAKFFWKYFAGCLIFHLNTMAFATFAASLNRDVAIATLIGNLNFTFQSMTNGLFANAKELPIYVRWCKYIAYLWYSFGYMASNEFTDFKGNCFQEHATDPDVNDICYAYSGKYILQNLGFWENWDALPICVVLAFSIGHYLVAGVILYLKPVDMTMGTEINSTDAIDNSLNYEQLDERLEVETCDKSHESIKMIIKNVNLSVRNKLKKSNKNILNKVSACFEAGKLNIIMGPSGSGKTSLLNLISGRLSSTLTTVYSSSGDIYLNGFQIQDYHIVRPICSYVAQDDDHLLSCLTVRETLNFAARLRLSKSKLTDQNRQMIVNDIILKMGLKDCANTLVGNPLIKGISGGEKRRLSIAIQLISSPKILFLDEPTSGLDSFTASSIIDCLQILNKKGTTVIMTIHQPRILEPFGSILLLAKGGLVAFNGSQDELIPYYASLGHPVPKLTNLADFVIDLISYNTSNLEIERQTKERVNRIIESWKEVKKITIPNDPIIINNKLEIRTQFKSIIKERANFIVGFLVMTHRQWIGLIRDKNVLVARTTQVIGMAIILSLFFARLDYDTSSVQDRLGIIQQITSLYFTGMLNNLASFPTERNYFYDEYNDDVVGLDSFFFSYFIVELPCEIFTCFVFAIFLVFVIGFQINAGLFFTIFYGAFMIVNSGESLGISFNTMFEHSGFALNIISIFCSIGVAMAGLLAMTIGGFLRAMNYLSPPHYCVMLVSNLTFNKSLKLTCSGDQILADGSCLFNNGHDVLMQYNLKVNMKLYYALLVVVTFLHRVISYACLKIKLNKITLRKLK